MAVSDRRGKTAWIWIAGLIVGIGIGTLTAVRLVSLSDPGGMKYSDAS